MIGTFGVIVPAQYTPVASHSGHHQPVFVPIREAKGEGKQTNELNHITYLRLPHPQPTPTTDIPQYSQQTKAFIDRL